MLLLLLNDQNYCLSFLLCKKNVAKTLNLPIEDVNIKATTEERLGFTGSEEGISSYAVCSIDKLKFIKKNVFILYITYFLQE